MVQSPSTRPLIAWLGDDFTGAAASMEVLAFAGARSVLFLGPPTPAQAQRFEDVQAFGIATLARSKSPEWMSQHLPDLFERLGSTGAELIHYKICSTLDSSPKVGSIGRAAELGAVQFGAAAIPVVTAAPRMGRYQIFGTHFCDFEGQIYRLDRHPVMARHPVTPMAEADVARHLSAQTDLPTACLDLSALANPDLAAKALEGTQARLCTIDMLKPADEPGVGRLLWEGRDRRRFVIGSQGIEYALVAWWQEIGMLPNTTPPGPIDSVEQIAAVSGSVSLSTATQIAWAGRNGFALIRLEALDLIGGNADAAIESSVKQAMAAVSQGLSPLILTATGPDDEAVARLRAAVANAEADADAAQTAIGQGLGRALRLLLEQSGLRRAVVSGGDTSGHVCTELGIFALEALTPTIPGAAICSARSENAFDGLEIALKGGQMGSEDYFGWIRDGGGLRQ